MGAMRPIRLDPAPKSAPPFRPGIFSRPFFEDKNRAFWMLQGAGWTGYLLLRSIPTIVGDQPLKGLVGNIMEAIIGYCITLLLSTLYGLYRRRLPQVTGILLAIATLAAATFLFAVLDAFVFSMLNSSSGGSGPMHLVFGSIYVAFIVLAGWSALYYGINYYLIVEDQIDQLLSSAGLGTISWQRCMERGRFSARCSISARTAGSMPWREVKTAWTVASVDDQSGSTGVSRPLRNPRSTMMSGSKPRPMPSIVARSSTLKSEQVRTGECETS